MRVVATILVAVAAFSVMPTRADICDQLAEAVREGRETMLPWYLPKRHDPIGEARTDHVEIAIRKKVEEAQESKSESLFEQYPFSLPGALSLKPLRQLGQNSGLYAVHQLQGSQGCTALGVYRYDDGVVTPLLTTADDCNGRDAFRFLFQEDIIFAQLFREPIALHVSVIRERAEDRCTVEVAHDQPRLISGCLSAKCAPIADKIPELYFVENWQDLAKKFEGLDPDGLYIGGFDVTLPDGKVQRLFRHDMRWEWFLEPTLTPVKPIYFGPTLGNVRLRYLEDGYAFLHHAGQTFAVAIHYQTTDMTRRAEATIFLLEEGDLRPIDRALIEPRVTTNIVRPNQPQ